jgi:predicted alpha/beta hydrolase family esterase
MPNVYLVHCWGGTVDEGWYPWLARKLTDQQVLVSMENMPDTDQPQISKWVGKLTEQVSVLSAETFFIGHSIGCQTILRYLETQPVTSIGGILLVAPWFDLLPEALSDGSDEIADEWIKTPIDFAKVCQFTKNITAVFSDNDKYVSLEQEAVVREKLRAKTLIVAKQGHISDEDGVADPEYLWQEMEALLSTL